jgi:hypothetical protein
MAESWKITQGHARSIPVNRLVGKTNISPVEAKKPETWGSTRRGIYESNEGISKTT